MDGAPDAPVSERRAGERIDALVVGGGLTGIAVGSMLRDQGMSFVLIEKADRLGGTWLHNSYPGCGCDVPSPLYAFKFRPNPDWTRLFAERAEILDYLTTVAEENDVGAHARLGTEMLGAEWDGQDLTWTVETTAGRFHARFLVIATGSLHDVKMAQIPGLDTFGGPIFHSAKWPEGYDGTGDRIAIIGTGASSIQITPALAERARSVTVFQRSAAWIQPKPDWRHSRFTRAMFRRFPVTQRMLRGILWSAAELLLLSIFKPKLGKVVGLVPRLHLRLAVKDPHTRAKLRPDYTLGCKRVLVSSDFYRAMNRPNVELIDAAAVAVDEHGVTAANGAERRVDAIVLATGFNWGAGPTADRVRGSHGLTLNEAWKGSPCAYLGTSVSGFPNLIMMWGPNASTGSVPIGIEAQVRYVTSMFESMRGDGTHAIDVREDVERDFKDRVTRKTSGSATSVGMCGTFYLDANGKDQTFWPGSMLGMWRELRTFRRDCYESIRPTTPLGDAAATRRDSA